MADTDAYPSPTDLARAFAAIGVDPTQVQIIHAANSLTSYQKHPVLLAILVGAPGVFTKLLPLRTVNTQALGRVAAFCGITCPPQPILVSNYDCLVNNVVYTRGHAEPFYRVREYAGPDTALCIVRRVSELTHLHAKVWPDPSGVDEYGLHAMIRDAFHGEPRAYRVSDTTDMS